MASLITGDLSARWVELCDRLAVFGFIFLSIGMGLGAVWAYVVLGWGGFWAWDAVENALCDRLAVFGFIFLSIGMGLGAVWAYVVLGWGGFWAWDAVENASLMSWLTCVAMIHSFTMYRKHGIFKRRAS